ncbi:MAG: hypothetical protein H7Z73_06530 [Candidatus Saccharibacteria bacterium]|nr:hypothetical protein [Moraxellaceae bacterium]
MSFRPFADESSSVEIAGLTLENHIDHVTIYGQGSITKDQQGLAQALILQKKFNLIVSALQNATLPTQIENKPEVIVDNPFIS